MPQVFPFFEMRGVNKRFGPVVALDGIDLAIGVNEVVGLVGDNGAGKSTLVKILSGVLRADEGRMFLHGNELDKRRWNVGRARAMGVETVHQERALGENQPLWRNVFVGRHRTNRLGFLDVGHEKRETLRILKGFLGLRGDGVTADAEVASLSGGERQGLAIGRAMYFDARCIILDEPTTALSLGEVDKVLRFIGRIREQGRSALFISHNMRHVYDVCDRFVVLDRGRLTHELDKADTSLERLSAILTGLANGNGGQA